MGKWSFSNKPLLYLVIFLIIMFTYASLQPTPIVNAGALPPGVVSAN